MSFQWVDEPNLWSISYVELMRITTDRLEKGIPAHVAYGYKTSEIPLEEVLSSDFDVRFRAISDDTTHVLLEDGDILLTLQYERTSSQYSVWVLANSELEARSARDKILESLPPINVEDNQALIHFWSHTANGPADRTRRIETNKWEEVCTNYATGTEDAISNLLTWKRAPDGGRLLVFHGVPGTGKTHAIRALAHEWRNWCDFHYVVDSEEFFGRASYMLSVLLKGESSELIEFDDEVGHPSMIRRDRWRLVIIEDADELLRRDAKSAAGQNLSRLLNLCDGLIGQGLRMLVLLTTNEKLGDLHPAIIRPGRCVAEIEFAALNPSEATAWLGRSVSEGATIAELYEMNRHEKVTQEKKIDNTPVGTYL